MSMEYSKTIIGKENAKFPEKILTLSHFVHLKSYVDWTGKSRGSQQ
jgi:hypothetical protein